MAGRGQNPSELRAGGRIEHYETKRLTKLGTLVDVSLTIGPIVQSKIQMAGWWALRK